MSFSKFETFAKPPDADAVQGVATQRVQTYHIDRQTSEQRTTQKCAADGGFAKVSVWEILGSSPSMTVLL
ncbi:hypothetical protein AKG43_00255 [Neisseria sp. 74A18]|nr:hypothetical protein AKG43_00255 [Neisseria sp. 74A18]